MQDQWIGRKMVAQNGRLAIEGMQRIDGRLNTPGFEKLKESFRRIEENKEWSATKALQDHFDAMTAIAENDTDLALLKGYPALFRNCESMLKALRMEGAAIRVV